VGNPLIFGLLFTAVTISQLTAATGWERLSELRTGDAVVVMQVDRNEYRGEFVRVSPDALIVRSSGSEIEIARSNIGQVKYFPRTKRMRNTLIGVAVGVGIALAIDKTVGSYLNNEVGYSASTRAMVWAIPIGLGSAIGALGGRSSTIYKAPRK